MRKPSKSGNLTAGRRHGRDRQGRLAASSGMPHAAASNLLLPPEKVSEAVYGLPMCEHKTLHLFAELRHANTIGAAPVFKQAAGGLLQNRTGIQGTQAM